MAYNATVIRLIAGCYYEWTKDGSDWKPLAEFLRDASFHPGELRWRLARGRGRRVAPGGISPSGQLSQLTEAVDYVVRLAKEE